MMKRILLMLAVGAACATAQPLLLPGGLLGNAGDRVAETPGNVVPNDSNPYNNPHEQCRIICEQDPRRCQKECPSSLPPTNEVFGPHSPQYQIDAAKDFATPPYAQPATDAAPATQDTNPPPTQQATEPAPAPAADADASPNQAEGSTSPAAPPTTNVASEQPQIPANGQA